MADGQLGGITVFPDSIDAVSSVYVSARLETTSSACKPAFAFCRNG
jgi:hypothetical protein